MKQSYINNIIVMNEGSNDFNVFMVSILSWTLTCNACRSLLLSVNKAFIVKVHVYVVLCLWVLELKVERNWLWAEKWHFVHKEKHPQKMSLYTMIFNVNTYSLLQNLIRMPHYKTRGRNSSGSHPSELCSILAVQC